MVEMLSPKVTIVDGFLPNALQKGFIKSYQDQQLMNTSEFLQSW